MIDYWLSINNHIPSQILDSPIIINSLPSHDLDLISQLADVTLGLTTGSYPGWVMWLVSLGIFHESIPWFYMMCL